MYYNTGYVITLDMLSHWIYYYSGYVITLDILLHGFHILVDGAIGFKQEVV